MKSQKIVSSLTRLAVADASDLIVCRRFELKVKSGYWSGKKRNQHTTGHYINPDSMSILRGTKLDIVKLNEIFLLF